MVHHGLKTTTVAWLHVRIESRVIGTLLCEGIVASLKPYSVKRFDVQWTTDWLSRETRIPKTDVMFMV